jgi:hypothetical protein
MPVRTRTRLEPREDEVGYGKPPVRTRFTKGQSGNPKGRPKKKPVDFAELIDEELQREIEVVVGDQRVKVTKASVVARRIVDKAAHGDIRAVSLLAKLRPDMTGSRAAIAAAGPRPSGDDEITSETYREVVESFLSTLDD